MSGDQELDRSEGATPFKLAEARKRGQVAKSVEVISAAGLLVAAMMLISQGEAQFAELMRLCRRLFTRLLDGGALPPSGWGSVAMMSDAFASAALLLVPMLGAVLISAIVANVSQTGPVFSWHPVKPDWNRLHPVKGLRRVFSMRTLYVALLSVLKLVLLCWVGYVSISALAPQLGHSAHLSPGALMHSLWHDLPWLGAKMAAALCGIAALDWVMSRREFDKNMRMSRREIKEEFKQHDGDPRVRARIRELRREMMKRAQALRKTAGADVLITNPTHIAVALRYRQGQAEAPTLLCKGSGTVAAAMRAIAARHRIPIVRSPVLARALHAQTAIDAAVPVSLYADVARILVWVATARRQQAGAGSSRSAA
jgi:flagellar biosynthesis protein FlhB